MSLVTHRHAIFTRNKFQKVQYSKNLCVQCNATGTQQNILILGGTGRVGSSTATALKRFVPDNNLILSGLNSKKFEKVIKDKPDLRSCEFRYCDIDNRDSLEQILNGVDIVVHCAGPFQQKENFNVIEAAIDKQVAYIDVCDDADYSQAVKSKYDQKAKDKGVPALITCGIYPGTSNIMTKYMIEQNLKSDPEMKPSKVTYNYFTAGSGGVGPTILETSFLLAGEEAVVYEDGRKICKPPVSERKNKDFGKGVGIRSTYLYNLPEVMSTFQELGVPNVSARFGTDPELWNIAMTLLPRFVSKESLQDRKWVRGFGKLVGGFVSVVDMIVGERVAMLVEVNYVNGKNTCGLYVHDRLSESVGNCVAAFAMDMLENKHEPGVHFPESYQAVIDCEKLLERSTLGCRRFIINKPKWFLDTEPNKLGMGLYV